MVYSGPAIAGPTSIPDCQAIDDSAMAVGNDALGTRLGASALNDGPRKARDVPSSTAMPYRIGRLIRPLAVVQASVAAIAAWHSKTMRATKRRSMRSAIHPTSGVSTNSGANCSSPIIPSRAELDSDIHRLARDVVGLPADDQHHAIQRQHRCQPRQPIGAVIGDGERVGRGDGVHGHPVRRAARAASKMNLGATWLDVVRLHNKCSSQGRVLVSAMGIIRENPPCETRIGKVNNRGRR